MRNEKLLKTGLRIVVHEEGYSKNAMIINPKSFPTLKLNDIICIYATPDAKSARERKVEPLKFYYKLDNLEPVKGNMQISILRSLSARVGISHRSLVTVERVTDLDAIEVQDVELSFKNQYIGRSDMWRIHNSLLDRCVCGQEVISLGSLRVTIDEVHRVPSEGSVASTPVASGLITSRTRLTFRSKSAQLMLMVQLSEEM